MVYPYTFELLSPSLLTASRSDLSRLAYHRFASGGQKLDRGILPQLTIGTCLLVASVQQSYAFSVLPVVGSEANHFSIPTQSLLCKLIPSILLLSTEIMEIRVDACCVGASLTDGCFWDPQFFFREEQK